MILLEMLLSIISLLITVAFYTLAERKLIAFIQRRKGPNVVGIFGLLQPLIDGIKAVMKEQIKPLRNEKYFFIIAPFLCFFISLVLTNFMDFSSISHYFDDFLNSIFFISISSFNIFGIFLAG